MRVEQEAEPESRIRQLKEQIRYCREEQTINQRKFESLRVEHAKLNQKPESPSSDDYLHQTLVEQVLALEQEHRSRRLNYKQIKNKTTVQSSLSSRILIKPASRIQQHASLKHSMSSGRTSSLHESRNSLLPQINRSSHQYSD